MRYDAPLPRSEKEEDGRAEEQQKAKTKQNQSVKISQKGASKWNKVWNLTVGQATGQSKVPVW